VQSWSVSCSVSGGLWWLSIGSGGAFLVNHILSDSIFLGFIMSSSDSFWVLFTGKNYSAWEFQFRLFVTGKELWSQIDGSDPAPTEPKELAKRKVKDARVIS
jgi:hypothetical protein